MSNLHDTYKMTIDELDRLTNPDRRLGPHQSDMRLLVLALGELTYRYGYEAGIQQGRMEASRMQMTSQMAADAATTTTTKEPE